MRIWDPQMTVRVCELELGFQPPDFDGFIP